MNERSDLATNLVRSKNNGLWRIHDVYTVMAKWAPTRFYQLWSYCHDLITMASMYGFRYVCTIVEEEEYSDLPPGTHLVLTGRK